MPDDLDSITGNTCSMKIQVMRLSYVTEELERCRTCVGSYYVQCEKYKPVKNSGGIRFRHLRLYGK